MIEWIVAEHGLTRQDAYMLCSLAGDLKILEVVDAGMWNVGFTLPLSIFARLRSLDVSETMPHPEGHDHSNTTTTHVDVESELLLEDMGYKPQLQRGLNILGNLALTLSDITPTASLLVVATAVIATAGTGSLWAYLIGGFIAVNVALCMGELGSMFPVAGGLYSIVTRVLGRPIGFLALLDYIGQAIFLPASVAFGIGTYINALYPSLSTKWIAAGMMILVALIACLDVRFNAWMIAFFLVLELGVVIMLAVAGFADVHQSLSTFTHPHVAAGANGIGPVGTSAIIAALATALFSVNGYDSAINFSEETEGEASSVGKAVVLAASIGIVFEIIPFIGVLLGPPTCPRSCTPPPLSPTSSAPRSATPRWTSSPGARSWPSSTPRWRSHSSSHVSRMPAVVTWPGRRRYRTRCRTCTRGFKMPWVATMLVGMLGAILCAQSSLISVVTFTAVLIIILYALIAISALVSRVRQKDLERPFRMPLWPVSPRSR